MTRTVLLQTLTLLVLMVVSSFVLASSSAELGISQLKQGNYEQANRLLLKAQSEQNQHIDLEYALALSYYFQSDWQQAKHYFKRNQNPDRTYPALFYLGKIAEFEGDDDLAQQYYEQVIYQYEDIEAQQRAEVALSDLMIKQAVGPSVSSPWLNFGMVSLEANSVDGLIDPSDANLNDATDISTSVMAAGGLYYVPKSKPAEEHLKYGVTANVYQETYQTFSDYDVTAIALSADMSSLNKHPWSVKLSYGHYWLAEKPYLSNTGIKLAKRWDGKSFKQTVDWSYIRYQPASSDYEHYEGDAKQLHYQIVANGGNTWLWKLDLTYRNEDKAGKTYQAVNDLSNSYSAFTEYGKDYIQAKVTLGWNKHAKWKPSFSAFTRKTTYDSADQFLAYSDDTNLTALTKSGTRLGSSAELAYQFSKNWQGNVRYQWLKEDLNDDGYDFENTTLSVGLQFNF